MVKENPKIHSKKKTNSLIVVKKRWEKPARPYVSVLMNEHRLSALYYTGANICCMSSETFRQVFPVGQRPEKLNRKSNLRAASSTKLEGEGIYPIAIEINERKFTYQFHIFGKRGHDLGDQLLSRTQIRI
jgi:hypothetical protein